MRIHYKLLMTALALTLAAACGGSSKGGEEAGGEATSGGESEYAGAIASTDAAHGKEVQALTNAILNTLTWIHRHSAEEIMAKMPEGMVGKDKDLYLAALKNTIPMYSLDGKMDPKGAEAVLAVFSEASPEVAKANIDVTKTWTNKYVDQAKQTAGTNAK